MPDYDLHLVWPTPIVKVKNPDHARLKPALVKLCFEREHHAKARVESGVTLHNKQGLYESSFDLFSNPDSPELQAVAQFCLRSVGEVASQLRTQRHPDRAGGAISVVIAEAWVHVTRDRGYHDTHSHPNCSWCGIYCVDPGESSLNPPNGTNRFEPPVDPAYADLGSEAYEFESIYICPEDGLLVLFPSYLRHSATVYAGTKERIVIAFNAQVGRPRP